MSDTVKADVVLDLKGLLCPMPVVKLQLAAKKLQAGQIVEGVATDPGVMADIPAWARTSGNEVIKMQREGKVVRFFVRRVK